MIKFEYLVKVLAGIPVKTTPAKAVKKKAVKKRAKHILDKFKTGEAEYAIDKKVAISRDFVFPVGEYHLAPDAKIISKNHNIKILPGTVFYMDDNSQIQFHRGSVEAIGDAENKIKFLPEDISVNMQVYIHNAEATLEHCVVSGFKGMSIKGSHPTAPLTLSGSTSKLKHCLLTGCSDYQFGGALGLIGGTTTLEDCAVTKNLILQGAIFAREKSVLNLIRTSVKNNHAPFSAFRGLASGIMYWDSNITARDCEFIGNTGGYAVFLSNPKAKFYNTVFRSNFDGAIGCVGKGRVDLDDKCHVEDNGWNPISDGLQKVNVNYKKSIVKEQDLKTPSAENLHALIAQMTIKNFSSVKEQDIPVLLRKPIKKYKLGESAIDTLTYELKRRIQQRDNTPPLDLKPKIDISEFDLKPKSSFDLDKYRF